jgi:imidazolonepropionase
MKSDLIVYSSNILTCVGRGRPKTGLDLSDVGLLKNAAIAVRDGIIICVGPADDISSRFPLIPGGIEIDAGENPVLPGLIDSHTHPVFAGNRVNEFIMRARGATYQEIHEAGGGIQFTVDNTRQATSEDLFTRGKLVLTRMLEHGTTTVEAKSGYGLETGEELRELRIIKKLQEELSVDIVPTFMGAHSIPREYKENRDEYIRIIIREMLPAVKQENLAKFVDIFCEEGAFTLEETGMILDAARKLGFCLKAHAEEFTNQGCAVMAAEMGALSVDHLLRVTDEDIKKIAKTNAIMTLMPGTLFFLGYDEYAPARRMIDGGAKVALATDFNAGSCVSASMQMAMALGCIKMKMTPEEVINAATYNASFAVGMQGKTGSIEAGKKADLVIFNVEDYRLIPYQFGENMVKMVIKNGKIVVKHGFSGQRLAISGQV